MLHFTRGTFFVHVANFPLLLDRLSPAVGLEQVKSLYLDKEKETFVPQYEFNKGKEKRKEEEIEEDKTTSAKGRTPEMRKSRGDGVLERQ